MSGSAITAWCTALASLASFAGLPGTLCDVLAIGSARAISRVMPRGLSRAMSRAIIRRNRARRFARQLQHPSASLGRCGFRPVCHCLRPVGLGIGGLAVVAHASSRARRLARVAAS